MIDRIVFTTGPAVGTNGVAVATGYSAPVNGEVMAVYIKYQDNPPAATTDFKLSEEDTPTSGNIISLSNTATSTRVFPRVLIKDNTGTNITYDGNRNVPDYYIALGRLKGILSQCNEGDYADITVWMRR